MATRFNHALPVFRASNGDLIRFVDGTTNIAQYSTNGGASWTGLGKPTMTYPNTRPLVACASTTEKNKFFLKALNYDNSFYQNNNRVGIVATYNTTTRVMTWSGGGTNVSSYDDASQQFLYVYGNGKAYDFRAFHDGTNVYILNTGSVSYDNGGKVCVRRNVMECAVASTFGTVAFSTLGLNGNIGETYGLARSVPSNSFVGVASSGKLLVAYPYLDTYPYYNQNTTETFGWYATTSYVAEITVSGTTMTVSSTATLDNGIDGNPTFVQHPTTKTLNCLYPGSTRQYTTALQTAASSTLPDSNAAFVWGTFYGPIRMMSLTLAGDKSSIATYESLDGFSWSKTGDASTGVPVGAGRDFGFGANILTVPATGIGQAIPDWPVSPYATCYTGLNYYTNNYYYAEAYPSLHINTVPSAVQTSPINGTQTFDQTSDTIPLSWTYYDFDGTAQTAYEILVGESQAGATSYYLASNGTLSASEQLVTSATSSATIAANVLAASAYGYQWSVRARDGDSEWSAWTGWNTFNVAGKPTVTITSPAVGSRFPTASNQVTVTYTYTDPEATAQFGSRVILYNSNAVKLWEETRYVGGTVASGGSYSHPVGYELGDGAYTIGIRAQDATGLWSNEVQFSFSTVSPTATAPTWTTSVDGNGIVSVGLSNPNGTTFTSATLYRWSARLNKYVAVSSQSSAAFTFLDRYAPTAGSFTYKVTLTGATGTRSFVSPTVTTALTTWRIATSTQMLTIYPENYRLSSVVEEEYLEPMGRSKQVRSYLGSFGYEGQLTLTVLSTERDTLVAALEAIVAAKTDTYLRSPFNASYKVALKAPAVAYEVGGRATITLDLTEVGDA